MSWNYRIVEYSNGSGAGLHEVQYDKNNQAISMTAKPAVFIGDTAEEVRAALLRARMDSARRPVFIEPADWV